MQMRVEQYNVTTIVGTFFQNLVESAKMLVDVQIRSPVA